ncbi:hypothetical protein [Galenea microaerophila]
MFCLFKNAMLPRWGQWLTWLVGWGAALAWLYFSLIDQGLGHKIVNGGALMVDLLLALPLTLFMAVILYAFFYWLARLMVILLFRNQITFKTPDPSEEDLSAEEALYGKEYWKQKADENSTEQRRF